MSKGITILGVDPGLAITGYGIIEIVENRPRIREAGVIRCDRRDPLEIRLMELAVGIREVIGGSSLSGMAIEQLYSHYERPRTAILMGHARGVLCLAAAEAGLAIHSYLPTKVKKSLTGDGRAPKDQMQRAIKQQLQLREVPEPPDVADALAVAMCHYYHAYATTLPRGNSA